MNQHSKLMNFRILFSGIVLVFGISLLYGTTRATATSRPPVRPPNDPMWFVTHRYPHQTMPISPDEPEVPAYGETWSKIAFSNYWNDNWEIYLMSGTTGAATRLTNHSAVDNYPRLNVGANRIAFVSNRSSKPHIYSMNVDQTGLKQLTTAGQNYSPDWSKDASKIIFESDRDGQNEIYLMNSDGSSQTRLTFDPDYDGTPVFSPDGSKIAFVSRRTGGYRIYTMKLDGTQLTQITTVPYSFDPIWSPDGSQIAFDAEADGDGWLELFLVNSDGSNQRMIYNAYESNTDIYASSWSPDGGYILYSKVQYVYYNGVWYWQSAFLEGYTINPSFTFFRLYPSGREWGADWKTIDTVPPVTSVTGLPAESPSPIAVNWSGYDQGPAGICSYEVQARVGASGQWASWLPTTTATSGAYPGVGGQLYSFRVRGRDCAGNAEVWSPQNESSTIVELLPPVTRIGQLPEFYRGPLTVEWGGMDPGGSGIKDYDVQLRLTGQAWQTWQSHVTATSASFTGEPGKYYDFRVRGTDKAGNLENWRPDPGDARTGFYNWEITGLACDNTDSPISRVSAALGQGQMMAYESSLNGVYLSYGGSQTPLQVTWQKNGYGALPDTNFEITKDVVFNPVMPPEVDLIENGQFENDLVGWATGGVIMPALDTDILNTGLSSVRLGRTMRFSDPFDLYPNTNQTAQSPRLRIASDGRLHVLWQESNIGLMYTTGDDTGTWSPPIALPSNGTGWFQSSPIVYLDSADRLHVMWDENWDIYYSRRNSDGNWIQTEIVFSSGYNIAALQMAVDANGVVHALGRRGDGIYLYAQRDIQGSWSEKSPPPIITGIYAQPRIGLDSSSTLHMTWTQVGDIYYSWYGGGGTWSTPVNLTISGGVTLNPSMVVMPDGVIYLAWWQGKVLKYTQRNPTGIWQTAVTIGTSIYDYHSVLLEVDPAGRPHLAWDNHLGVFHSARTDTGVWQTTQINPPVVPNESWWPDDLTVLGNGDAHILVSRYLGYPQQYYSVKTTGGLWTPPINLSNQPCYATGGEIGIDSDFRIHTVWATNVCVSNNDPYYSQMVMPESDQDSSINQNVLMPTGVETPILSFMMRNIGASPVNGNAFSIEVSDGIQSVEIFHENGSISDWKHYWFDLSSWSGKNVTLKFSGIQRYHTPVLTTWLDEVSLGNGYPNLWVNTSGLPVHLLPGEQATFSIHYGNRSGLAAPAGAITLTLPADLEFISASVPPASSTPDPHWVLGILNGHTGPDEIQVTVRLSESASIGNWLPVLTAIRSAKAEHETLDNDHQSDIWVGYAIQLPIVRR